MTHEEKQQRISALEAELEQLKKPEKTPAQRFWELASGTTLKFDFGKYSNTLFGFREDQYVWEFNFKNHILWLRYSTVWSILQDEFRLDYNSVQRVIKNEVEEHFKCKGVTPKNFHLTAGGTVEEHFKCKGVTPRPKKSFTWEEVEEHFKCKGVTPDSGLRYLVAVVEEHFKCKGVTPFPGGFRPH